MDIQLCCGNVVCFNLASCPTTKYQVLPVSVDQLVELRNPGRAFIAEIEEISLHIGTGPFRVLELGKYGRNNKVTFGAKGETAWFPAVLMAPLGRDNNSKELDALPPDGTVVARGEKNSAGKVLIVHRASATGMREISIEAPPPPG